MKILFAITALCVMCAGAGLVEFGGHAGVMLPSGENVSNAYKLCPMVGLDALIHMPMFAVEGSIDYVILQTEHDFDDYSGHIIPILVGLRTYSGPFFYGGGGGAYLSSFSYTDAAGTNDNNSEDMGIYGTVGMILPTGGMDIEGNLKYHLVDFDFDQTWFSITAGINF